MPSYQNKLDANPIVSFCSPHKDPALSSVSTQLQSIMQRSVVTSGFHPLFKVLHGCGSTKPSQWKSRSFRAVEMYECENLWPDMSLFKRFGFGGGYWKCYTFYVRGQLNEVPQPDHVTLDMVVRNAFRVASIAKVMSCYEAILGLAYSFFSLRSTQMVMMEESESKTCEKILLDVLLLFETAVTDLETSTIIQIENLSHYALRSYLLFDCHVEDEIENEVPGPPPQNALAIEEKDAWNFVTRITRESKHKDDMTKIQKYHRRPERFFGISNSMVPENLVTAQDSPQVEIHVALVFDNDDGDLDTTLHAARAIEYVRDAWKVDIISTSFGFTDGYKIVKDVNDHTNTLMFAASPDSGATEDCSVRCPAQMKHKVICIHAADGNEHPTRANPPENTQLENASIPGECVPSGKREDPKNGESRKPYQSGTSIATPMAVGVAALVAEFAMQSGIHRQHQSDDELKISIDEPKSSAGISSVRRRMTKDVSTISLRARCCLGIPSRRNWRGTRNLKAFTVYGAGKPSISARIYGFKGYSSKSRRAGLTNGNLSTDLDATPRIAEETDIDNMSNHPKSWFILPNSHFPPNTLIKLGQIVASPVEPHQAIDTSGPLPFPPDMPQVESYEEAYSWDAKSGSSGHSALSAEVGGLPVNAALKAEFKRNTHNWAQFENLATQLIAPTRAYVNESMMRPVVKTFLGKHLLPKSVFMITGVKIAKGAEKGVKRDNMVSGGLNLGIAPAPGIPIALGPDVGGAADGSEEIRVKVAKDFVWAISLRQIHYRRGKVRKEETLYDGATLACVEDDSEGEAETVDPSELDIDGVDQDPKSFTGEGTRLLSVSEKHEGEVGEVFLVAGKA
ncbi:unnamed protein product [Diplocarpon coronariae]